MALRLSNASAMAVMRVATFAMTTLALSSCNSVSERFANVEFFPAMRTSAEKAPTLIARAPVEPLSAKVSADLDPLNAPPPPKVAPSAAVSPNVDPMTVAPSNAGSGNLSGSQLVPLGALTASDTKPAAKRTGPAPLIPNAPQPAQTLAAPVVVQPAPAPVPVVVAPKPQPAPMQKTDVQQTVVAQSMAQPETLAAPAAPRATLSDLFNRVSPSTDSSAAAPGTGILLPSAKSVDALPDAREFVPAAITPAQPLMNSGMASPKLTVGESNVMRRFQVLARLLDEGLITQEEHDRRRVANVGALLPYSKEPPGIGLDRSVPSPGAISARLQTLGRALEMRAITSRQHELERGTILNSLLPEKPDPRAPKMPPPSDMFALADAAGRLGYLREENLITEAEFAAEKSAMDRVMRGSDPIERKPMATASKASGAGAAAALPGAGASTTSAAAVPNEQEKFSGPVLHLASFRSAEGARSAYEQAKAKNPQLFANLRYEPRRTNITGQGTFYRLLVGPFVTLADAEATCVEMKKVDQFCRPTSDGS